MKKILSILPSEVLYGKERSNIEVYKLLKEQGYEIKIIVNKKWNIKLQNELHDFDTKTIAFPSRGVFRFRILKYVLSFVGSNISMLIQLLKFRPDILFMNTESCFYDLYPSLKFFTKKLIYRIGDEPKFPIRSFYKYNSFVWNHYVIKRVDVFVCISQFILQSVRQLGRKVDQDLVIYNYPPGRNLKNADINPINIPSSHDLVFGYIGQLKEIKGVHDFIKAAIKICQITKCCFLIAGSLTYDEEYSTLLKNEIPEQFKNQILFLGELDNISDFFSKLDVLCVPSIKQEPLGNVIVEAKQYSKAVIIYPSGGMPELIHHKKDGYVCKESSVDELIVGMNYYIENRNLVLEHGNNSYDSIDILGINRIKFEQKWIKIFDTL